MINCLSSLQRTHFQAQLPELSYMISLGSPQLSSRSHYDAITNTLNLFPKVQLFKCFLSILPYFSSNITRAFWHGSSPLPWLRFTFVVKSEDFAAPSPPLLHWRRALSVPARSRQRFLSQNNPGRSFQCHTSFLNALLFKHSMFCNVWNPLMMPEQVTFILLRHKLSPLGQTLVHPPQSK